MTWISVKDRLPKTPHDVWISFGSIVSPGYLADGQNWYSISSAGCFPVQVEVTHWQEYPDPPGAESQHDIEYLNRTAMLGEASISCNLPWERIPQHASDPGCGPVSPKSNVVYLVDEPDREENHYQYAEC